MARNSLFRRTMKVTLFEATCFIPSKQTVETKTGAVNGVFAKEKDLIKAISKSVNNDDCIFVRIEQTAIKSVMRTMSVDTFLKYSEEYVPAEPKKRNKKK